MTRSEKVIRKRERGGKKEGLERQREIDRTKEIQRDMWIYS